MDLVVHQMVQLQHIDISDGHLPVERLAGAPIDQGHLAGIIEARHLKHIDDIGLMGSVENGRSYRNAAFEVFAKFENLLVV